ncbi:MAG: hypothetical protein K6G64_01615 [Eubacterium sp.]|nr:hypothetical protein [Eubacterium sp.]
MKFKAVDEINHFSFQDCQVVEAEVSLEGIRFQVEALIVRPENSQNTNFTESYAGTTEIRFIGGTITSGVKDGFKYYNADDVLIKEIPDTVLSEDEVSALLKKIEGAYLYEVKDEENEYILALEFVDESDFNTASDSYTLKVKAEKVIVEWDFYMNRVQH